MARRDRDVEAEDLIDELVHQFSDPFAFYRELIQNGIDAGSTRIEVTLSYRPARGGGTCTATVADWGEGMNRGIIEDYLLTKFRSSKEDDLTKIGKFGIGFLSVFAPEPDLVVVETGRDGEAWRILFHPDRTYELFAHPEPVEGTRVGLHKAMGPGDYLAFLHRSEDAVRRWCRHSEAEVTFAAGGEDGSAPGDPAAVNEPLTVEAAYQVEYQEEGTRIVAGIAREPAPLCGLYNRGLTLLETREPPLPGVTFKIVSRYLEHTLTRDSVRKDDHYQRAMKLLDKLVEGPLLDRLPAALQAAAARPNHPDYVPLLAYARSRLPPDQLWFPAAHGAAVSPRELKDGARGVLLLARKEDVLVERLWASRRPALIPDEAGIVTEAARVAIGAKRAQFVDDLYVTADAVEAGPQGQALCEALRPLGDAAGYGAEHVALASFCGAGGDRLALRMPALGVAVAAEEAADLRGSAGWLCLNHADPRVAQAVQLARQAPALAAALLIRLLAVSTRSLDAVSDWRLTEAVLRR